MAITHLYGSLSKNITDIVKGGGCPAIKAPNKKYSVLRYFSRFKDDNLTIPHSVVGDGGLLNDEGISYGTDTLFWYEPFVQYLSGVSFRYKNLNLNDCVPHVDGEGSGTFVGENNFLNLCNRREIISGASDDYINDQAANSIQNIELANDVIERDVDDYFNYNLYKKSHTMDIILAGTETPVSKTAELMEFVYLHAFIPKCKSGELYIEIEDFDLEGDTTNDYLIYCYYWESAHDRNSIADAFANTSDYMSGNADFLLTDQGNTCCKVFRLSDVKGTGEDKKLIVWLNRLKTKSEKFAVNVLIGMNPQELRRDESFTAAGDSSVNVIDYDECDDIVFKFKNANIKIGKFAAINNQPLPFPNFGYKELKENVYADNADEINIPISALDVSGNALPINTQTGIVGFGVPNGGTVVASSFTWTNDIDDTFYPPTNRFLSPEMRYADGVISSFSIYNFYRATENIVSGQNYILKLPSITDAIAGKTNTSSAVFQANNSDWVIKIYAGNELVNGAVGEYAHYKDLIDSLILIKTITVADMADGLQQWNSGDNANVVGTPFTCDEGKNIKKNFYGYASFAGSVLSALDNPVFFYMSIERTAHPITSISYGATGDGDPPPFTFYYPSGYGQPNTTNEIASVSVIPEYLRTHYNSGASADIAKNYHAMLFQAPQIIDKTDDPEPENYFST